MAAPKGNEYWMLIKTENIGRKLKFTPDDIKDRIIDFIQRCVNGDFNPTITGLALHLGFCDRGHMSKYQEREEFINIIKIGRTFVENYYENQLTKQYSVGAIFALKQMGWTDQVDINQITNQVTKVILSVEGETPKQITEGKIIELKPENIEQGSKKSGGKTK